MWEGLWENLWENPWELLLDMCLGSNLAFLAWVLEVHGVFKYRNQL